MMLTLTIEAKTDEHKRRVFAQLVQVMKDQPLNATYASISCTEGDDA